VERVTRFWPYIIHTSLDAETSNFESTSSTPSDRKTDPRSSTAIPVTSTPATDPGTFNPTMDIVIGRWGWGKTDYSRRVSATRMAASSTWSTAKFRSVHNNNTVPRTSVVFASHTKPPSQYTVLIVCACVFICGGSLYYFFHTNGRCLPITEHAKPIISHAVRWTV